MIIRGSTYTTTENGKTVTKEDWPKANWLRLPAYKIEKVQRQDSEEYDDVIVGYYTYKVVEDPVENYTTEYVSERKGENGEDIDLENDGVSGGIIDVTNTYIPPTTKIGVHKNFKVPEGTALPEQIIVHLMQIKTDKDGNVYAPVDYGMVRMLTEQNDWSELFTGLPTRDGNGNTYTYTVVEDTDALEEEGFTYTQTEYVLDGVKDSTSGGLISGTVEINNHGPGSLKIEKNVTINGIPVEVGDSGADGTYTFHVMRKVNDELVEITDKYEDETPKSPVTITIENGASNYAMVSGLDAGDYYIHEDVPANGTSLTSGNDVKVVVVGGVDDPNEVDVGSFTNNIDKTRVKVHKTWVNANRDAEGNIINGTNNDWPRGMTVQMELRKVQDGSAEHVKVDTPTWYTQNNKTWSDTIVLNAVRQFGVFDNLDTLETGWTYVVDETIIGDNPERYEAFVGAIDADGNIEIVNAEKTQALFTKKWENTSNESGEGNYKRPNLKISFRLKQFYVNAAGEKVETAASATQTGIFAPKTIAENTVLDEKAGAVTITKEATTGAEWNVLWNNLPAEGEEAGTAVTYFYEVEELGVTASDVDAKADYDTTYSEDKLTVTNRYNKATSAAVGKTWSDGKPHDDVNVTMTLYKSYVAYDGTGSLYSANVQVDNWKDMANYTIVGTELKKDATKEQPTVSWTDLPKYTLVSGAPVEIVYNVTETSVTVTTNSSEAIYSNPETIADHWTSRLEGETLTNIPRTIDVEGTKTWITNGIPVGHPTVKLYKIGIREDDPPTRQVVKAGTATSNDSDDEESTDPDMEPTCVDDEHYRFTGLRKYDDNNQEIVYKAVETEFRVKVDDNTYTYTVTWNQEDDTYTVTSSDSNAPAFVVLQSDNNLTNKEVKTATVTKEWGVEDADESKIESITYHLTRKIDEVEDTTFNNDASNTVTVTKAESGTTDWGKTWNNLDAHGTITYTPDGGDATTVTGEFVYTVDETQFVVKWGEDDSTEVTYTVTKDGNNYTVENPQDDYHFWKATKSGDKFTNTLDETYLDVVKLWSMNGNIPTSDTEDSIDSIFFYLYRKAGTSTGELVDSVTKKGAAAKFDEEENPTGAHPFTISKTQIMENGQGTGRYEWKRHIDGLEKTDGTNAYTYWIEEVVVPGYVTTPQITLNSSDGATVNSTANAPAESKIFITNSKYNVSLPSTGGPGTTIFYVLGSILTLLAMVLLITKKRTEGQGID